MRDGVAQWLGHIRQSKKKNDANKYTNSCHDIFIVDDVKYESTLC